ncbi:unnamed protein product [Lupinus luteus]|uniref:Uncharacterized protein n=1 Tax=Lupinus luteus TaxID=3873 RepID=A0AAV1X081_LUPLU
MKKKKVADWRVIIPTYNKQTEITLEVNVDGEYTGQCLAYAPPDFERQDAIQYSTLTIEDTNWDRRFLFWFYKMQYYFLLSSMDHVEVLKSIVYGGLTESLASLTVVASAASADASTLSIVALVLANLISGLFIFLHDYYLQLQELKGEEAKNQTETCEERYYEVDVDFC